MLATLGLGSAAIKLVFNDHVANGALPLFSAVSIGDLFAMMLSKSVVLMSMELQTTTWFMESYLKPYLHFVPVDFEDPSDLKRKIQWCEENLEEAKNISERATLFVHDLLFKSEILNFVKGKTRYNLQKCILCVDF